MQSNNLKTVKRLALCTTKLRNVCYCFPALFVIGNTLPFLFLQCFGRFIPLLRRIQLIKLNICIYFRVYLDRKSLLIQTQIES